LNGKAVMGAGGADVSVDGTTPALLVGVVAGSAVYGPAWLNANEFVFRNGGAGGAGPWDLSKFNVAVPAITSLNPSGSNDLAAGNGKWALWLNGTGVISNITGSPFSGAALADVSSDFGELVLIDTYPAQQGLTVKSAAGATLLAVPGATLARKFARLRGHIVAYQTTTNGWQFADVTGAAFRYCNRTDEEINWITPLKMASGKTLLLERSNRLTLRYADRGVGWEIAGGGQLSFNPDIVEYPSGTLRIGWSTNAGESAWALVVATLIPATGVMTRYTVVGGVLTPSAPVTLASQVFPVGPVNTTNTGGTGLIPYKVPVIEKDSGRVTKEWLAYFQNLTAGQAANTAAIGAIPPSVPPDGFGAITSTGQPPVLATAPNDQLALEVAGGMLIATDPAGKKITFDGTGAGVSRALILAIASLRA